MKAEALHSSEALRLLSRDVLRVTMLQLQSQSDDLTVVNVPETRPPSNARVPTHDPRMRLLEVLDSALSIAAEVDEALESMDRRDSEGELEEGLKGKEGNADDAQGGSVDDENFKNDSSSNS
jgi:hypothetical protein